MRRLRTGVSLVSVMAGSLLLTACSTSPTAAPSGASPTTATTTAPTTSSTTSPTPAPATTTPTGQNQSGSTVGSGVTTWPGTPVSTHAIPLGDGHVSTTGPKVGYVYSCTDQFRGGGARATGPWIDTAAGTWDNTTKLHVEGSNMWPSASHSFTLSGSNRILATNDLPTGEPTGNFPISPSDPAYQYDTNPNHVAAQSFSWTVPADPTAATSPSCLGLGPIGVSTDGVVFFDALDAAGRDAGAHEIQDSCDGHPQARDIYHYHTYSPCLDTPASEKPGSSTLVGYALDGYGIYLERDAHGNLPTDADLGVCHGRTSAVTWGGTRVVMYHYDVTAEYPYTVGCYHGTPVATAARGPGGAPTPPGTTRRATPGGRQKGGGGPLTG